MTTTVQSVRALGICKLAGVRSITLELDLPGSTAVLERILPYLPNYEFSSQIKNENSQRSNRILSNDLHQRLIDDPKHGNDMLPLWLRNELGKDTDIVERSLSVCQTHWPVQNTNASEFSRMVPTILTTR